MEDAELAALAHGRLDFNSPLSEWRAAELVEGLDVPGSARVLDLGCGWGELLLRLLATRPGATGIGVDTSARAVDRGIAAARARGLADRVAFEISDAAATTHRPADVVLCVGSSHAWGGTPEALGALRALIRPGGTVLFGEAFWEREPTEVELAGLGARREEYGSLADLVELAMGFGFRPLEVAVANQDEWDSFESRWCAGLERWLLDHPDSADADQVGEVVDRHRSGWLRGYRGVLGFAYLTLAVSRAGLITG
jgi:SAM-dependent methyltransferase